MNNIKTGKIRIFSINAFMRPPLIQCGGILGAGDFKNLRLMYLLEKIKDYDVVLLQEMFALGHRQQSLISAAKRIGFSYFSGPLKPNLASHQMVDGGLLILSKYPLIDHDCIVFKSSSGADGMCSKGVLYVRVQLSPKVAGALHVFTVHTQAGEKRKEENIRMSQIQELADFIAVKVKKEPFLPILIGGDFNMDARNNYIHIDSNQLPISKPCKESDHYKKVIGMFERACNRRHVISLLKESSNKKMHPITNGKGHGKLRYDPNDPHNGVPKCIDYLFWIPSEQVKQDFQLRYIKEETGIDECLLNDIIPSNGSILPITHVSDHYGLYTSLQYNTSDLSEWQHWCQDHADYISVLTHCFPPNFFVPKSSVLWSAKIAIALLFLTLFLFFFAYFVVNSAVLPFLYSIFENIG